MKGLVFKYWAPVATVRYALKKMPRNNFENEKAVQDAIERHFETELDGLEVLREFPYDRIKADFVIERHVAVEVKHNLTKTSEFQRLIGQLETYAKWGIRLVVVVYGELHPDLRRRIEARLSSDWGDEDNACLVHVLESNNAK